MSSFWDRIETGIAEARERTLGAFLDALAAQRRRRDEAAFSVALIALSAKMAKADGVVTDDEIEAFRDYFHFPEAEADKVRMIYQLAQQDVAGYREYLKRVARIFASSPAILEDVLDCLFHVAQADGVAHPRELELLDQAAEAFNIKGPAYHRLKAAHLGLGDDDPHLVLGIEPGADIVTVKSAYRALSRDHHPDALMARGVPADLFFFYDWGMSEIYTAYEQILRNYA